MRHHTILLGGKSKNCKMRCCHHEPAVMTQKKGLAFSARVYSQDSGPKRFTDFWKLLGRIRKTKICPYICEKHTVLVDAFQERMNGACKAFQVSKGLEGLLYEARVEEAGV